MNLKKLKKGSSSGIGTESALAFAKLDSLLVITGRDEKNVAKVALECSKVSPSGHEPLQVVGDVAKLQDLRNLRDKTLEKYNKLDVLINNAGRAIPAPVGDNDHFFNSLDDSIDTNLKSAIRLTALFKEALIKSKGNVINISSVLGERPAPMMTAYSATKAGLEMAMKSIAAELTPQGVRVNGVAPAVIETPIWLRFGAPSEFEKQVYNNCKKYPVGRHGKCDDLIGPVKFLASSEAAFITGTTLMVDGGFLLTSCGMS